jgi:hypothetical protein
MHPPTMLMIVGREQHSRPCASTCRQNGFGGRSRGRPMAGSHASEEAAHPVHFVRHESSIDSLSTDRIA